MKPELWDLIKKEKESLRNCLFSNKKKGTAATISVIHAVDKHYF